MKDQRNYRRRNYFIDKPFQTKFILKFCILLVFAGLLSIFLIYFLSRKSTTVSIVNSRVVVRSTADFLLPLLFQTIAIVSTVMGLATIVVCLFTSHKIVGPLYRFKKVMKEIELGDLSMDFHLRHNDQLKDLAASFDSMIKHIRDRIKELKTNIIFLNEKLNNFSELEIKENKIEEFKEIKIIAKELEKIISYFKS